MEWPGVQQAPPRPHPPHLATCDLPHKPVLHYTASVDGIADAVEAEDAAEAEEDRGDGEQVGGLSYPTLPTLLSSCYNPPPIRLNAADALQ